MTSARLILELLAPELILAAGACIILLVGLSRSWSAGIPALALIYVAGALYATWTVGATHLETPEFMVPAFHHGSLVWFGRTATLAVGALILLVGRHVPEEHERAEFFALILFSLCGVSLVAGANDLVLLFLALELVSVPTYVLIGLSRRDIRAQEATGKYFFLGAFAAAMTLYGFSFLYGAAGTMRLAGPGSLGEHVTGLPGSSALANPFLLVGLLLAIGGLAFKIAAVPLHFYVADVYQGAASPVTGLLGFVPKFAGFLALVQIFSAIGWRTSDAVFWLLWVLAALTMTVGNTLALMQQNVKRMLAYSSVAHSGYMLVALVAGPRGVPAILFYAVVYGIMNLGAFAALSYFRKPGIDDADTSAEMLDDLAGTARRHPWACLALAVCVLGLMGFPLTGGFFGKFYLFTAAISADQGPAGVHHGAMIVLVVIGVLNAAVGAAYYLRILAACYLPRAAAETRSASCGALRLALGLCAAAVLLTFVRPGILFDETRRASYGVTAVAGPPSGHLAKDGDVARLGLRAPE